MQNGLEAVYSQWAHTTGQAKPMLQLGSLLCQNEEILAWCVSGLSKGTHTLVGDRPGAHFALLIPSALSSLHVRASWCCLNTEIILYTPLMCISTHFHSHTDWFPLADKLELQQLGDRLGEGWAPAGSLTRPWGCIPCDSEPQGLSVQAPEGGTAKHRLTTLWAEQIVQMIWWTYCLVTRPRISSLHRQACRC